MQNIFQIYLYLCGIIVSIAVLAGLIGLVLNLICYAYQNSVGFNTFRKFLKKYNKEMQNAKKEARKERLKDVDHNRQNKKKNYNKRNNGRESY